MPRPGSDRAAVRFALGSDDWSGRATLSGLARSMRLARISIVVRVVIRTFLNGGMRSVLALLAVVGAITLILVFEGFRVGLYRQVSRFPAELPGDLVATQKGVSNVLGARPMLPQDARLRVEGVPGVKKAHPLGGLPLIYSDGERATPVYVVAYDTAGGPRALIAGHPISALGEIIVDESLARRYRMRPGSRVEFLGYRFTIAGLSADTSNFFNPYVFIRLVDLVDLYVAGDLPGDLPLDAVTSFLLIDVEPGVDRAFVRAAVERQVDTVSVFTPAELAENDVHRAAGIMGPPLDLLVGIAYLVGILVVGLTLYGSIVGRLPELVVMKALGAGMPRLAMIVAGEAVIVAAVAFGVAIVAARLLAIVISVSMPGYLLEPLAPEVVGRTALATLAIACAGSLGPLRRVVTVDPAQAFRQGA